MATKITEYFGSNLAELLGKKIKIQFSEFDSKNYIRAIADQCEGLTYTQRVELHAKELKNHLPEDFIKALKIIVSILGSENPEETGMFTNFYWVMPIGKFIELFGLDHPNESLDAIEEITKRNTGEYAVRPYIREHTTLTMKRIHKWVVSDNFHLRRLASEGLRPKLPWAPKLDTFIDHPRPVFEILELLKEDEIKFVKKSVANHLTDYLKVNPEPTRELIKRWKSTENKHTLWIIKHATRKIK